MKFKGTCNGVRPYFAAIEALDCASKSPEENDKILELYSEWLEGFDSLKSRKMLRTQYHAVENTLLNPLTVKW
ncbi:20698_t:CDS:2 [Entrophospora sp. SA101]|nr:20698_t:CDS:2 [Entrophospora sp. SA101]